MNDPLRQFRACGWCVIPGVIAPDRFPSLHFHLSVFSLCYGGIAPSYLHNGDWRTRALELALSAVPTAQVGAAKRPARGRAGRPPSWTEWAAELPFYLRPAHLNDSQVYAPDLAHPRVNKLLEQLLGKKPCAVSTSLVVHEPGTPSGPWRAGGPFRAVPAKTAKHVVVHWLFTAFTKDNGGLPVRCTQTGIPIQPRGRILTAPAGSVLIVDGSLESAIAANTGDLVRMSAVLDIVPARDKTAQAVSPAMSDGVYHRLPAPLQSLYRSWRN